MLVGEEGSRTGRIGQSKEDGSDRLEGKVGGEGVFLESGELWAWEDAEGDYAADEGLEEGRTKEGAVAGWIVN